MSESNRPRQVGGLGPLPLGQWHNQKVKESWCPEWLREKRREYRFGKKTKKPGVTSQVAPGLQR